MKNAIIAAVVAAIVASGSAAAAATSHHGPRAIRVIGDAVSVYPGSSSTAWADCPGFRKAIGGGFTSSGPIQLEGSYPLPDVAEWDTSAYNPGTNVVTVQTYAVCVR